MSRFSRTTFAILLGLVLASGCALVVKDYEYLYGPSAPLERRVHGLAEEAGGYSAHTISYKDQIQPILDKRCVVCHSCNDAPCQLNLSSLEGLDRGWNRVLVYNALRFRNQDPTRLGVDASNTAQWRKKAFLPVLNERVQNEQANLDNSLLYKMLVLKRNHPMPTSGRLPASYSVGTGLEPDKNALSRQQQCTSIEYFERYAMKHPEWGMPLGFPAIDEKEFTLIESWLRNGGLAEQKAPIAEKLTHEIDKWEKFLNGTSNKQKLMSRYLYEHLFLGHLYFDAVSKERFFMLVRSRTAPGLPIDVIATVRPYDKPVENLETQKFYYRLQLYDRTIVDKTHLPYALNDKKLARINKLFLAADYDVDKLPSYEASLAANPFRVYASIPAQNRYRFLLDNAQFFIGGFIKGPVCRGPAALSVIDDHFWVVFTNPDTDPLSSDSGFLEDVSRNLRIPSEQQDDISLLATWTTYKGVVRRYFRRKLSYLDKYYAGDFSYGIEDIWDGDKKNQNAALTVYRHVDSATVLQGFVGEIPKTGWVIDYPIFERIHYLLAAGFNVYGTAGHQLATRLYMDFLRIEAELQFLAFLPSNRRAELFKLWYRGSDKIKEYDSFLEDRQKTSHLHEPRIVYHTGDVKSELFQKLSAHMKGAQKYRDFINRCHDGDILCTGNDAAKPLSELQHYLREMHKVKGKITDVFSNVSFLRIIVDDTLENDLIYTIVRNKSYLNTTFLSPSEDVRIKSEDTLDIVKGFVGSYPNFFFAVKRQQLAEFVRQYAGIRNYHDYNLLVEKYAVRRTNPAFWENSDWFYAKHRHDSHVSAGLFDLNRYQNR